MYKPLLIAAALSLTAPAFGTDNAPVPYPQGYRQWTHVKSMTINEGRRGWGFEGFKGDSKTERAVGANAASACFQCHTGRKDHDFIFSAFRK